MEGMDSSTRNLVIIIVLLVIVLIIYSVALFKYKRDDFSGEVDSLKKLSDENKHLRGKLESKNVDDIVQIIEELDEQEKAELLERLTK